MKKILFAILAIFVFVSCSSDESELMPTDGQYVAYTDGVVYVMQLQGGNGIYFAPFINGSVLSSWLNVNTSGEYPNYTYRIDDFVVQAHFDGQDSFTATLAGSLKSEISNGLNTEGHYFATEATGVKFRLDNTVLDANGDGILDSKQ